MQRRPVWVLGVQAWLWLTFVADILFAVWLVVLAYQTLGAGNGEILGRLPLITSAGLLLVLSWGFYKKKSWLLRAEIRFLALLMVLVPIWWVYLVRGF